MPGSEIHQVTHPVGCTGATVQVFGADYDTPDGTSVRDYVHVSDIADAHLRALKYLLQGGESCALNLANSRGYSVKEVIKTMETTSGRRVSYDIAPRRPGDRPVLSGMLIAVSRQIGWQPARLELHLQIRDAVVSGTSIRKKSKGTSRQWKGGQYPIGNKNIARTTVSGG